jgi:hypothetical protein
MVEGKWQNQLEGEAAGEAHHVRREIWRALALLGRRLEISSATHGFIRSKMPSLSVESQQPLKKFTLRITPLDCGMSSLWVHSFFCWGFESRVELFKKKSKSDQPESNRRHLDIFFFNYNYSPVLYQLSYDRSGITTILC